MLKNINILQELLRNLQNQILPETDIENQDWFNNQDNLKSLLNQKPKCIIQYNSQQGLQYFSLCNQRGIRCPKTMQLSIDLAKKLAQTDSSNELLIIISKLSRYHNRYNKDVPKPHEMAYKKGQTTQHFNKLKNYLDQLNGKN